MRHKPLEDALGHDATSLLMPFLRFTSRENGTLSLHVCFKDNSNSLGLEAYSICSLHKYWFEKESVCLLWCLFGSHSHHCITQILGRIYDIKFHSNVPTCYMPRANTNVVTKCQINHSRFGTLLQLRNRFVSAYGQYAGRQREVLLLLSALRASPLPRINLR